MRIGSNVLLRPIWLGVILGVLLSFLAGCSGDAGTSPNGVPGGDITFSMSGNRIVQVWSDGQIALHAIAKSGETPTLTAASLPDYATFVDSGNGACLLVFCPTSAELGNHMIKITAQTSTELDSVSLIVSAVDNQSSRKALIPISANNRWIYQSVRSRAIYDTVTVTKVEQVGSRNIASGNFFAVFGMLPDGLISIGDTIISPRLGRQFLIPSQLPQEFGVNSRGICYEYAFARRVQWITSPVVVPAGTFVGCFKYTSNLNIGIYGSDFFNVAEEIFIKPGLGMLKISQVQSTDMATTCSSRWELWSSDIRQDLPPTDGH